MIALSALAVNPRLTPYESRELTSGYYLTALRVPNAFCFVSCWEVNNTRLR